MLPGLLVVVMINGIKDFVEDRNRKISDNEENNKTCEIFDRKNKNFIRKKWEEVNVGDFIKINKNEEFPADIVLFKSANNTGNCYIETKNLDGETNLKIKNSEYLLNKYAENYEDLAKLSGILITRMPNENIFEFDATIKFNKNIMNNNNNKKNNINNFDEFNQQINDPSSFNSKLIFKNFKYFLIGDNNNDKVFPIKEKDVEIKSNYTNSISKIEIEKEISIKQNSILLRGCSLKLTDYIIGVVVYTGHDTKIMKNSPKAKSKTSRVEDTMNTQILTVFLFQIILATSSAISYMILGRTNLYVISQYIFPDYQKSLNNFLRSFFERLGTWILIFTNFVPISLLVTLEMIKFIQAKFICWDVEMYCSNTFTAPTVQTSTLNDELGQIQVNLFILFNFFEFI
jgi:magnesium-transporting ATPase (P-type)